MNLLFLYMYITVGIAGVAAAAAANRNGNENGNSNGKGSNSDSGLKFAELFPMYLIDACELMVLGYLPRYDDPVFQKGEWHRRASTQRFARR